MEHVFVYKVALPGAVKGVTVPNSEGDYIVFINDNLSDEVQARALRHEMRHIKLGHFSSFCNVAEDEREAEHTKPLPPRACAAHKTSVPEPPALPVKPSRGQPAALLPRAALAEYNTRKLLEAEAHWLYDV